jgi:hypothetical protein
MSTTENTRNFVDVQNEAMQVLQTVYDPEIPVNIYELGLNFEWLMMNGIFNKEIKNSSVTLPLSLLNSSETVVIRITENLNFNIPNICKIIVLYDEKNKVQFSCL